MSARRARKSNELPYIPLGALSNGKYQAYITAWNMWSSFQG